MNGSTAAVAWDRRDLARVLEARQAGAEVYSTQRKLERANLARLLKHFATLKASLTNRLLAGPGGVTDFRRFTLQTLIREVDRLIAETTQALEHDAEADIGAAARNGVHSAEEPTKAAGLLVTTALPGLDSPLVAATFANVVDLLSPPMAQFATDVKTSLRRVALAGDQRFEEIQRLRDKIQGQGFDNAQFRAERIIRTEVGRVFNEAQFERLTGLAATFPFLRKGWRSTKDSRTRLGHVEAGAAYVRGQGIPVAEKFAVRVYDERGKAEGKAPKLLGTAQLRFPIDPQAEPAGKLAAGATIMCRCNSFVDFDRAALAAFNRQRVVVAVTKVPKLVDVATTAEPALPTKLPQPKGVTPAGTVPRAPGWPMADSDVRRPQRGHPATPRWIKSLTVEETKALKLYMRDGYKVINHSLRTGDISAVTQARADRITAAIEKAGRFKEPVVVYRGLQFPPDLLGKLTPGQTFQAAGFQSTSFDPGVACHFKADRQGVVLEIKTDRGAFVEPLARFKEERELLLQHNQRFRIIGRKTVKMRTLEGKIIDQVVVQVETVD